MIQISIISQNMIIHVFTNNGMRIVIQNQDTCPTVQGKAGKHLNRTVILWASYTEVKIEYVVSNDIVKVIVLLCGMQAAFQAEVDSGPQGPWVLL